MNGLDPAVLVLQEGIARRPPDLLEGRAEEFERPGLRIDDPDHVHYVLGKLPKALLSSLALGHIEADADHPGQIIRLPASPGEHPHDLASRPDHALLHLEVPATD